jgi:hypothetical protein
VDWPVSTLCQSPYFLSYFFFTLIISGADLVEVSPAYDVAEVTAIAAADLIHDFLSMFLSEQPPKSRTLHAPAKDEL